MTLEGEFDRVWPWLHKSILVYGDTHRKEHVWAEIEAGGAQLWTTENAALVTVIKVWPTGLREAEAWLVGGDLEEVKQMTPQIELWAKHQRNCKRAALHGARAGWTRALDGYRAIGVVAVKDL